MPRRTTDGPGGPPCPRARPTRRREPKRHQDGSQPPRRRSASASCSAAWCCSPCSRSRRRSSPTWAPSLGDRTVARAGRRTQDQGHQPPADPGRWRAARRCSPLPTGRRAARRWPRSRSRSWRSWPAGCPAARRLRAATSPPASSRPRTCRCSACSSPPCSPRPTARAVSLIFILLAVCSDIGGYFAGITLTPFTGGHQMAPVISSEEDLGGPWRAPLSPASWRARSCCPACCTVTVAGPSSRASRRWPRRRLRRPGRVHDQARPGVKDMGTAAARPRRRLDRHRLAACLRPRAWLLLALFVPR